VLGDAKQFQYNFNDVRLNEECGKDVTGEGELLKPAGGPSVGNPRGVGMHRPLHILPVVVLLGVSLHAGVVAGGPPADEGVLEPKYCGCRYHVGRVPHIQASN
jgi:hypothetical protein